MVSRLFYTLLVLLGMVQAASAQQTPIPKLGEKGFMHTEEMHSLYQSFFGPQKCHCSAGQCRPSDWRRVTVSTSNPSGIQMWVNGMWCPVPEAVLLKHYLVPAEVMEKLSRMPWKAHVCAYSEPRAGVCPVIECALALSDS
ncbi:MAG: hypothetical protein RIQ56_641 [Candidatus Parcubacteria bacterium]|jgi:hypothetical protein